MRSRLFGVLSQGFLLARAPGFLGGEYPAEERPSNRLGENVMKNVVRHLTLAIATAAILAAPAMAQRPGGPGQGGPGRLGGQFGMQGGLVQTLNMPPVVEELKLSEEQVAEARTMAEQVRSDLMSRMQESREQFADLSPEERRERMESILREMDESTQEKLKELLEADQMSRLLQIQVQQLGLRAFANPRIQSALKLDDEQKATITKLEEDVREKSQAFMANARDAENRGEAFRELMELRRSSLEEVMSVLTDEQKTSWKELTGEPLEMGPGGFGRGGPGARPGQGGRGPGNRPSN